MTVTIYRIHHFVAVNPPSGRGETCYYLPDEAEAIARAMIAAAEEIRHVERADQSTLDPVKVPATGARYDDKGAYRQLPAVYYTFNQHHGWGGYDHPDTQIHATAWDAAMRMLAYDCQNGGISKMGDGPMADLFVPWQRRMDGTVSHWTNLAGLTEEEAALRVLSDDGFAIEAVTAAKADELEDERLRAELED